MSRGGRGKTRSIFVEMLFISKTAWRSHHPCQSKGLGYTRGNGARRERERGQEKESRRSERSTLVGEIVGFSHIDPSPSAVTAHGRKSVLNIPAPVQTKSLWRNVFIWNRHLKLSHFETNMIISEHVQIFIYTVPE